MEADQCSMRQSRWRNNHHILHSPTFGPKSETEHLILNNAQQHTQNSLSNFSRNSMCLEVNVSQSNLASKVIGFQKHFHLGILRCCIGSPLSISRWLSLQYIKRLRAIQSTWSKDIVRELRHPYIFLKTPSFCVHPVSCCDLMLKTAIIPNSLQSRKSEANTLYTGFSTNLQRHESNT